MGVLNDLWVLNSRGRLTGSLHFHLFMNLIIYQPFIGPPAGSQELCPGGSSSVHRDPASRAAQRKDRQLLVAGKMGAEGLGGGGASGLSLEE